MSEEKKKQKAGLNGVRPDEWLEGKFKNMAKETDMTQTEMFTKIFLSYLNKEKDEKQKQNLDVSNEISLISQNLDSILNHFKSIVTRSQHTIGVEKELSQETSSNCNKKITTLTLQLEALVLRNTELENSNKAFEEVKLSMENKLKSLSDTTNNKDIEIRSLKDELMNSLKIKSGLEDSINKTSKELEQNNSILSRLEKDLEDKDWQIDKFKINNETLTSTIEMIKTSKNEEILSIEREYERKVKNLNEQLIQEATNNNKNIVAIETQCSKEYNNERKLLIAENKLELIDVKEKFQELLKEYNSTKETYNNLLSKNELELTAIKEKHQKLLKEYNSTKK